MKNWKRLPKYLASEMHFSWSDGEEFCFLFSHVEGSFRQPAGGDDTSCPFLFQQCCSNPTLMDVYSSDTLYDEYCLNKRHVEHL